MVSAKGRKSYSIKIEAVTRTDVKDPFNSLGRSICYPDSTRFGSKVTTWGCAHEKDARIERMSVMTNRHADFSLSVSGLIVNPAWPFLGASPNGIINCTCCGMAVLEIKCPFTCKERSFLDVSKERFFLHQQAMG